jgi:glucose-1-phosphate thymidylyltransferase
VNAILLAAGYATRLYPLTRDRAKPLLPVAGRPILDYLVDQLEQAPEIRRLVLVSNAKFLADFERWAGSRAFRKPLSVLNDGSTCNENRRGAVADVQFALEEAGLQDEPAYVLATDNLPRFDLRDAIACWRERGVNTVYACAVADRQLLRRMGVADLAPDGRVVSFEEKPQDPKGEYRIPPFYVYTVEAVAMVCSYLAEGGNPDAPGHFLGWLVRRAPVYALRRPEGTHEIGTLDAYRAVCERLERRGRGEAGAGGDSLDGQ